MHNIKIIKKLKVICVYMHKKSNKVYVRIYMHNKNIVHNIISYTQGYK